MRTPLPTAGSRNLSLDGLRVLSMLMIVLNHCLCHGQVLDVLESQWTVNRALSETLMALSLVAVNCFVLVSGYFLCTSRFRLSKWLKLWGSTLFWSVLLFVALIPLNGLSLKGLVQACLPFTQNQYWFVTTYLLMYLLAPICNWLIQSMDRRQHLSALLVYFLVFILLQNLSYWSKFTEVSHHSPMHFLFLYFAAAYVRKYPPKKRPWLLGFVVCMGFVALWRVFDPMVTTMLLGRIVGDYAFNTNHAVPVVVGALCLFLAVVHSRPVTETLARWVAALSPLTFGVYLIHDHPGVRIFLWQELLRPFQYAHSPWLIPLALLMALGVFLLCALLERGRLTLFRVLGVDRLWDRLGELGEKLFDRGRTWLEEKI